MSTTLHLTVAEFDRMVACGTFDDLGRKVELIRGKLVSMNPAGPAHDDYIGYLTEWSVRSSNPRNVRIQVQTGLNLDELESRPEPDIFWVKRARYVDRQPTAADTMLAIEVADSSLKTDRIEKAELYAEAGIPEYWVVDIRGRSIYVRREIAADFRYGWQRTVRPGETISPLAEPKAILDVSDLFDAR
jgi:Uma2 family endonuclease